MSADGMKWRVLPGVRKDDGATCMAIDRALLTSVSEGRSPPTIRVYRWSRETVSFARGRIMRPLVETGVDLAQRPSGGKALYHHPDDLTYCIVAPLKDFLESYAGVSRIDLAKLYSTCLGWQVSALRRMSIDARIADEKGDPSDACLLDRSTPHNDVLVEGKKVSGNAVDTWKGAFMLHGSVFYDPDPERIAMVYAGLGIRKNPREIDGSITGIRRWSSVSSDDAIGILLESLKEGKECDESDLSSYESYLVKSALILK